MSHAKRRIEEQLKPYTFSFGKHKGESIEDIDDGYLIWVHENFDHTKNLELIEAIENELFNRAPIEIAKGGPESYIPFMKSLLSGK